MKKEKKTTTTNLMANIWGQIKFKSLPETFQQLAASSILIGIKKQIPSIESLLFARLHKQEESH